MTQTARPTSDVTVGSWTTSPLFSKVNDSSDATLITGPSGGTTQCELQLGSLTDPVSSANHIMTVRAKVNSGSGAAERLTWFLYEGATLRATSAATSIDRSTITDYTYTLSGAEADSITDYTNLRMRIQQTTIGGSETINVYEAYFQVPDAAVTRTTYGQAQAAIKITSRAVAQAQAQMLAFGVNQSGQAQADIKAIGRGYGQSNADIRQTYQGYSNAQAKITSGVTTNAYAQAQADIKAIGRGYAQALADIEQTYSVSAQANADIRTTYRASANSMARIKQTYSGYSQAQASIKAVSVACGAAQGQIRGTSRRYAQAQAQIFRFGGGFGQAQAWIRENPLTITLFDEIQMYLDTVRQMEWFTMYDEPEEVIEIDFSQIFLNLTDEEGG